MTLLVDVVFFIRVVCRNALFTKTPSYIGSYLN